MKPISRVIRNIFLIGLIFLVSGCATMSNRTKTILAMAAVGVVAGTVGAMSAPADENPVGHGLLWGGLGASSTGALGLWLFDEHKRSSELERESEALKKELSVYRIEAEGGRELVGEAPAKFVKDLPDSVAGLVRPGHWKVWKLDKWINEGENRMVHQDKMIEIAPPQLNPNAGLEMSGASQGVSN